MEALLAIGGMLLNIVRGAAQAEHKDPEFDWRSWLGERPLQVATRLLVVVGLVTPEIMEQVEQLLAGVELGSVEPILQLVLPFLIGRYGDRVTQPALEVVEDVSDSVPLFRKLWRIGKRLT